MWRSRLWSHDKGMCKDMWLITCQVLFLNNVQAVQISMFPLVTTTYHQHVWWQCGRDQFWSWHCESKWVIWVGQITQTQHLSKDYKNEQVVVCLHGTRGEIAYGEGDASTPKGWCRCRQRALLTSRSGRSQWEWMPGLSVEPRKCWTNNWIAESIIKLLHLDWGAAMRHRGS